MYIKITNTLFIMKKLILSFLTGILFFGPSFLTGQNKVVVFEEILFYDGYNTLEKLENEIVPVPDGVYRLKTSVITTKLTEEQLGLFGDTIEMEVIIKAACDNYDRLGHVHLALVPKGTEIYDMNEVDRYELGRFITPFMNKNKQPDTVPYTFNVNYLKHVFKDKDLLEEYDFWMELDVFGVPYAANTEISGCSGRNDVFYGSLNFITSDPIVEQEGNVLIPIFNKFTLNNYNTNSTDELYETRKSAEFTIENDLPNCKLVLITSNHGANSGGEEYNRRWHYIYFNDNLVLSYKPGRKSCEEFRKYNTQGNGIYGSTAKTDEQWQSFSNWCPGDVIDTRVIELGDLSAGTHQFTIDVPDAVFADREGYFPLSLYFLSTMETDEDYLEVSENEVLLHNDGFKKYVQVNSNTDWNVTSEETWLTVEPVSENGNSVTLVFSAGNTTAQRTAMVEVWNDDTTISINVTQNLTNFNVNKNIINIPAEGSTETFTLTRTNMQSNISYDRSSWITVNTSSNPLTLTVGKNATDKVRIGFVSFRATGFDDRVIKVFQEAGTVVSIKDITADNQIIIYPNPTSDGFYVEGLKDDGGSITIVNIIGQQIISKHVNNNDYVDISALPAGIYLVKILYGGLFSEKKIIKK